MQWLYFFMLLIIWGLLGWFGGYFELGGRSLPFLMLNGILAGIGIFWVIDKFM